MEPWSRRLRPERFTILGGEPTLCPVLPEIVEMARGLWPDSHLRLTTNGFFLNRHPRLPEVLSRARAELYLSIHDSSAEYQQKLAGIFAILGDWRSKWPFDFVMEETTHRWTRRHHGTGAEVLPYEDGRPRRAWEACRAKTCRQLFEGSLWKCAPIAYLQLQKRAFPSISSTWDPYLAYAPLSDTATDEEVSRFLSKQEEDCCRMCPASPEPFRKQSPLISLGSLRRREHEQVPVHSA